MLIFKRKIQFFLSLTSPPPPPPPTGGKEKGKKKMDFAARTLTLNKQYLHSYTRVNYFTCVGKGGGVKDIHCNAQKSALFVDLL